MKKVIFVSKTAAENAGGWGDWAVISITEENKAELQEGWFGICRLQFHDVDPTKGCEVPHVLMDAKHAMKIVMFVNKTAPNIEGILVHCKAGISRSAAVAKWIAEKYNLPFEHRYESYNKHVYKLLKEADEVWMRSNK